MRHYLPLLGLLLTLGSCAPAPEAPTDPPPPAARDWDDHPLPPAPAGKRWALDSSHTTDFNYASKQDPAFNTHFRDTYHNPWTGPGLTNWETDMTSVEDGKLVIAAARRPGTDRVNCGVVTSRTPVKYPLYTEARIRVSDLELSSNFWMLSEDNEREIDVLEIYGGAAQGGYPRRMSNNFHVFFRDDDQIHSDFADATYHALHDSARYRDDYHTFGVRWLAPDDLTFFIDGQPTEDGSWAQADLYDKGHTRDTLDKTQYTMDRPLYLILDTEDHAWRSRRGIVADDASLADSSRNRMYVDWVRTYRLE